MAGKRFWRFLPGPTAVLGLGLAAAVIALAQEPPPAGRDLEWPFRPDYCGGIERLAFSSDGKALTAAGGTGAIASWDVATGRGRGSDCSSEQAVVDQALGPDGKTVATVQWDDAVQIRDLEGSREDSLLTATSGPVHVVAFSPDGKTLATGGRAGLITLRDLAGKRTCGSLQGPAAIISCLAFSADGAVLAAGDQAGRLTLWDLATRRVKAVVGGAPADATWGPRRPVRSLAISPDGTEVALVRYFERSVTLCDAATGVERATLRGHTHEISTLAYAPGNGLLASGAVDGMLKLWDTRTARQRSSFRGHSWQISALAFSPDGRLLASADADSFLRLWDMNRMQD